jgi:DNA-binding MarR family transcriptional regulator
MVAATSITRAHQILLGRINEALAPFGLTFSRYEALALLSFTRRGELPLARMGERLQVHPTSITNTIDRLEAAGLVQRRPHPTDGRTTLAAITPAGRSILPEATAVLDAIEFGMAGLARAEQAAVSTALTRLRHQAGDF